MPKILVIDDELKALDLTLQMLEFEGYTIVVAEEGTQGLALAQSEIPDLVLCDVMLPDLDGFGVIEGLRSSAKTGHIPVIFMSGFTDRELTQRAYRLGALNYLIKPFSIGDLLAMIRICINA